MLTSTRNTQRPSPFPSKHQFETKHDSIAATCELPLAHARVPSTAPRTFAIDRFSHPRQRPIRALANQNATSHLRQSRRLGGFCVISHARLRVTQQHAYITQHRTQSYILQKIFFRLPYPPLAKVPFFLWELRQVNSTSFTTPTR